MSIKVGRHADKLRSHSALMIGLLFGGIALTMYPIFVSPYMNQSKWKKIQKESRKDIVQEDIQPGGMKVWSDPFSRK